MGDIKKQRKKSERPANMWEADRLAEEKTLMKEYGLGNKRELWKFRSMLKRFRQQAKILTAKEGEQTKKEEKLLINKLIKLNLAKKDAHTEDVLGLDLKQLLDRRLQTQILKIGLARTARQARQFIVHGHISVNGHKVSIPSYLVKADDKISFLGGSTLAKDDHPERIVQTTKEKRTKILKVEPVQKVGIVQKVEVKPEVPKVEAPKVEEVKEK